MGGGKVCGAKKPTGGKCGLAAGWGTNHPGIGVCKLHGGATKNHIKAAARESYKRLLGDEIEIDPLNALLWCIRHAAGEMVFWGEQIDTIKKEEDWFTNTIAGKTIHHYVREQRLARDAMHRYSADAVKLGIAERQVRMAEMYGAMIATLVKGIITRLQPHLDPAAMDQVPIFVREAMVEMESMQLALPSGKKVLD